MTIPHLLLLTIGGALLAVVSFLAISALCLHIAGMVRRFEARTWREVS